MYILVSDPTPGDGPTNIRILCPDGTVLPLPNTNHNWQPLLDQLNGGDPNTQHAYSGRRLVSLPNGGTSQT